MIQRLEVDVRAGPDVVLAFHPVDVDHGLILIVVAGVRHVELGDADVLVRVEVEDGHPALEGPGAVQTRNPQQVHPLVLTDVGMGDVGVHPDVAEVRVGHEGRREHVGAARREVGRVALSGSRISAGDRHALQGVSVHRLVERPEIEVAVAAEDVQLRRGVPIHLRVERPAIEFERRSDEVVVRFTRQVRQRHQADDLLRDWIDATVRNDVARKGRAPGAVRAPVAGS